MALSGSINTNAYGDGRYYTLSWTATQSVTDNRSAISWTLSCTGGSSWYAERTLYVVIAGNVVINKTDRVERYAGTIASGSFTVNHATDGTYGFTASIQAAVYTSTVNCTGSGSFSLNQIPRQAVITSAPNFNDEENPVLKYSNPAGSAVSSLQACISLDGSNPAITYKPISTSGSSYTFSLTDAEREVLRNATLSGSNSRNVYYLIKTVIGSSTFITPAGCTFTVINAEPTLEAEVYDSNDKTVALTGDSAVFVRYKSNASFNITATAKKGATITARKVTCGGSSASGESGTISAVGSGIFDFSVTDNRGNTVPKRIECY